MYNYRLCRIVFILKPVGSVFKFGSCCTQNSYILSPPHLDTIRRPPSLLSLSSQPGVTLPYSNSAVDPTSARIEFDDSAPEEILKRVVDCFDDGDVEKLETHLTEAAAFPIGGFRSHPFLRRMLSMSTPSGLDDPDLDLRYVTIEILLCVRISTGSITVQFFYSLHFSILVSIPLNVP